MEPRLPDPVPVRARYDDPDAPDIARLVAAPTDALRRAVAVEAEHLAPDRRREAVRLLRAVYRAVRPFMDRDDAKRRALLAVLDWLLGGG